MRCCLVVRSFKPEDFIAKGTEGRLLAHGCHVYHACCLYTGWQHIDSTAGLKREFFGRLKGRFTPGP